MSNAEKTTLKLQIETLCPEKLDWMFNTKTCLS